MSSFYNEEVLQINLNPNRFCHLDIAEQGRGTEKQRGKNELTG